MLVVLDGRSLNEALTADSTGVRTTLLRICDQIVETRRIYEHWQETIKDFTSLLPELESLRETRPRSKLVPMQTKPVGEIIGPRSEHDVLAKDAIGVEANFLITKARALLRLDGHVEERQGRRRQRHDLRIVTPSQYVADAAKRSQP